MKKVVIIVAVVKVNICRLLQMKEVVQYTLSFDGHVELMFKKL